MAGAERGAGDRGDGVAGVLSLPRLGRAGRAAGERARGTASRLLHRLVAPVLRVPLHVKLVGAGVIATTVSAAAGLMVGHVVADRGEGLGAVQLALVAGIAVNWVLVVLALRPLRILEHAVDRIWRGDLAARVTRSSLADARLVTVGRTLNLLLDALAAERERLRTLAAEVLRAGERERATLARELHDSTAQSLAAVLYQLTAAERQSTDPAMSERLREIRESAGAVLDEVRHLAHAIHPRVLDDLGLLTALERLANQLDGSEVAVSATLVRGSPESARSLSGELAATLYRVAQEATQNAVRHAAATHVWISLSVDEHEASVEIADDGEGFDAAAADRRRAGLGLFTMEERAALVGGTFELHSTPGIGTRVRVAVPRGTLPLPPVRRRSIDD